MVEFPNYLARPVYQDAFDHGIGDSGTVSTIGLAVAGLLLASAAATGSYLLIGRPVLALRQTPSGSNIRRERPSGEPGPDPR